MLPTKTLEIDWNGVKAEVVIRKLDWVTRQELLDEIHNAKMTASGMTAGTMRLGHGRVVFLLRVLAKAPFTINLEGLREVDPSVLERIYVEAEEFNQMTPKKSPGSTGPSSTEQPTASSSG